MNGILTPPEWSMLEAVFNDVIEIPLIDRSAFLDEACRDHQDVRSRVESLLNCVDTKSTRLSRLPGQAALDFESSCSPREGDSIGPYKVVELLGRGGMGVVFKAVRADDIYEKIVAVKVSAFALPRPELAFQFQRERQILASLEHPNIAMLLDGGAMPNGAPYFVMEYVDGQPINKYCDEHRLALRTRLQLFLEVAAAVQYAHRNLVIHRDLKPGNILITSSGSPKLLDFGIAKLLTPDVVPAGEEKSPSTLAIMTTEYASPEQIRGQRTGVGTDVYQLGVVLYELLTGARPFRKDPDAPGKLERDICECLPEGPRINPDVDVVILKALEKAETARYATVADFAADIQRYLDGFPVLARRRSWTVTSWKFLHRNRWAVTAVVAFLVLVLGFGIAMAVLAKRASEEARTSDQVTEFLTNLFDSNDPTQSKGRALTARELLDRGASRIESSLKEDPLTQARLFDTVGRLYDTLGARPQAQLLLRKSLFLRQHRLPGNDMATANTLRELGNVYAELGQIEQALAVFEQAVKLYRKSAGETSVQLGTTLDDLGIVTYQLGDTRKAEQLLRQSININVKASGAQSRDSLRAMNNLVFMLKSRGDYVNSEPLARQVLSASIATQGPYSEAAGSAQMNLAMILKSLGKYSEAERILRTAVNARTTALGQAHPDTIFSTLALGSLLTNTGKLDEADSLTSDAFKRAQTPSGEQDGTLDYAREVLAFARLAKGRGPEARSLLQSMFEHDVKTLPPSSGTMAATWSDLGTVDQALSAYPLAVDEYEHALEIQKKRFGMEGIFTANTQLKLAQAFSDMGDLSRRNHSRNMPLR